MSPAAFTNSVAARRRVADNTERQIVGGGKSVVQRVDLGGRGESQLVGQRRRMLAYLRKADYQRYLAVTESLSLRHK